VNSISIPLFSAQKVVPEAVVLTVWGLPLSTSLCSGKGS